MSACTTFNFFFQEIEVVGIVVSAVIIMGLGYDPGTDIPDLSGRVILITGGKSLSSMD